MAPDGGTSPWGPPTRGKILIIERNDQIDQQKMNMNDISPFIIGKHLKDHAGELKSMKLQRDGTYHVECKTDKQATSLLNLRHLQDGLNVIITEHPTKNKSRNIFSSYELKGLSDEGILDELKKTHKNIEKVKRFTKKVEGREVPTSSFLVTYNSPNPLSEIKVAFNLIKTRAYYPSPFRCFNCLAFGHATVNCKKSKVCAKCSEEHHEGPCTGELKCAACNNPHHTFDKKCPIKIQENKVVKVKIDNGISFKEAKAIVEKENATNYAKVLKKNLQQPSQDTDKEIKELKENIKILKALNEELQQKLNQLKEETDKLKEDAKIKELEYQKLNLENSQLTQKNLSLQLEMEEMNIEMDNSNNQIILSPPRKQKKDKKNQKVGFIRPRG